MNNDQTTQSPTDSGMQSMACRVCQKVTLADGSQVWVCKECGTEHQPGQAAVVDPAAAGAQAAVDQAAASTPTAPADQPAAPAATDPTQTPTQ